MNVTITPPITLNLSSAKIITEDAETGTIMFKIEEQPVMVVLSHGRYAYDSAILVGDRVKVIRAFGAFGLNSEGVVQEIIIDSTNDTADVLFDKVYPNTVFSADVVEANSGIISVLFRMNLRDLAKI